MSNDKCLIYGVDRQDIKCFCLGLEICRENNCPKQKIKRRGK